MAKPTRQRPSDEEYFGHLNSRDDLTAIIHGYADLEALVNEAVAKLLAENGIASEPIERLSLIGKVDLLTLSGRLDPETRGLFVHIASIRHRFAHEFGSEVSEAEGKKAWSLMPKAARDQSKRRLRNHLDDPGGIVRWCIVVLRARVMNRAVFGHKDDLPYC